MWNSEHFPLHLVHVPPSFPETHGATWLRSAAPLKVWAGWVFCSAPCGLLHRLARALLQRIADGISDTIDETTDLRYLPPWASCRFLDCGRGRPGGSDLKIFPVGLRALVGASILLS